MAINKIPISNKRIDTLEKRAALIQAVLLGLLFVVIMLPITLLAWYQFRVQIVHSVRISDAQIVGPRAVCPGEQLVIEFQFIAAGAGILDQDATMWRMTPPATVIDSESTRFILATDIDRLMTATWTVPETYIEETTGLDVTLPPGDYKRILAISSPSTAGVFTTASVDFSIKDCEASP